MPSPIKRQAWDFNHLHGARKLWDLSSGEEVPQRIIPSLSSKPETKPGTQCQPGGTITCPARYKYQGRH
ncbi:hypothetical protein MRX96_036684 [Rhipicephalus microplus]